jgi:FixJ family two-component response regulator
MAAPDPEPIYVAVIDDDDSVRRSCRRWLRAAGFHPVEYASAEVFLDDRKHHPFRCLVLDIHLTGISGIELHRRLAEAHVLTPVIYLTANDDPGVQAEALANGCFGFFLKTTEGSLVLESIRRAVGVPSADAPIPCESESAP